MYLLDTNVISEFRKIAAGKADDRVTKWSNGLDFTTMHISVITIHELEIGTLRIEQRDPPQGAIYREWLDNDVLVAFSGRILALDFAASRIAAKLHVHDPAPFRDAFIAATAVAHGMTVVTRNTADFVRTGVPLLNPWH